MIEGKTVSKNQECGQVTLGHLLLAIAFCMPMGMAMAELKHSGGGLPRYLVAAPSALVIGALIVSLDWKLGKAVWLRFQMYPKTVQDRVAIALFALDLLWIVAGAVSGLKLATFVADHVPR